MQSARNNCSAKTARATPCANVKRESEIRRRACARNSVGKPPAPPSANTGTFPSPNKPDSADAKPALSNAVPSASSKINAPPDGTRPKISRAALAPESFGRSATVSARKKTNLRK